MKRTTVLLAGFDSRDLSATKDLLDAGACVLHAPGPAGALEHLKGGLVDVVLLPAGADHGCAELKRAAEQKGVPVLELEAPLDGDAVCRLVTKALEK